MAVDALFLLGGANSPDLAAHIKTAAGLLLCGEGGVHAPAAFIRRRDQAGGNRLRFLVNRQFAQGSPTVGGELVVQMFQAEPPATVGAGTHAHHHLLQSGLSHTDQHFGGLRVGLGVHGDERRGKKAALRQPLLRLHEFFVLVCGTCTQACQLAHQITVMALQAADAQLAQSKQRPRVQRDFKAHRLVFRVHIRQRNTDLPGGVAQGGELSQCLLLGGVPAGLGKPVTRCQLPAVLNQAALGRSGGIVGNGT